MGWTGLEQRALRSYLNVRLERSPPTALQSREPLAHVPGLLVSAPVARVPFEQGTRDGWDRLSISQLSYKNQRNLAEETEEGDRVTAMPITLVDSSTSSGHGQRADDAGSQDELPLQGERTFRSLAPGSDSSAQA